MEGSPEAGESDYLGSANLAPADNIPTSLGNQFRMRFRSLWCRRDYPKAGPEAPARDLGL